MRNIFLVFMLTLLMSGCSFDSVYHIPKVALDAPSQDLEAPVGTSIYVRAHTLRDDPSIRMSIEVNGAHAGIMNVALQEGNPALYVGEGSWVVPAVGEYRLHVRLQGNGVNETSDEVRIRGYLQPTAAPLLAVTPEATLNISTLPPQLPALPSDTPFPTITLSPSETPPLPIEVNFWANELEIAKGKCTVLHWEVKHAQTVSLNNNNVEPIGKRKVCPSETTTFVLRAQSAVDAVERLLVIKVTAPVVTVPTDTGGPAIQQIQTSYQKIYWPADCSPNQVVISAMVNDPSGVKSVSLFYRVVDGKRQGEWREKKMSLTATNTYAITLIAKDFQASLNPPVESGSIGALQYYILAIDSLNNHSQSKPYSNVEIDFCLY